MSNEELKNLISESFLFADDKERLSQHLDKEGANVSFYNLFNTLLSEEVARRGVEYEKAVFKLEELAGKLEKEITDGKAEIEGKIEKRLKSASDNSEAKTKIWTDYYSMLDELGQKYETGLRKILGQVMEEI